MNKFIIPFAAMAVSFLAFSCTRDVPELTASETELNLVLECLAPTTRSTEEDAENAVQDLRYFFFAEDGTGTALLSGQIESKDFIDGTTARIALDKTDLATSLKAGTNKYLVYAIANLPGSVTLPTELTLSNLQALSLTTDFLTTQNSFVMDGRLDVDMSAKKVKATLYLQRLAAKLTMKVNIPSSITVGDATYTPDPSSLLIYYLYAQGNATLDGTPVSSGAEGCFHYPYNHPTTATGPTDNAYLGTADPFYTYPESWNYQEVSEPYFKVVLSWEEKDKTNSLKPYYYKVVIPSSIGTEITRNNLYAFTLDIGVLGSENDEGETELEAKYYVVDWVKKDDEGTDFSMGTYLTVPRDVYYIYGEDEITIPVTSSHDVSATVNSVRWVDYSTQTPSTKTALLSQNPSASFTATGRESVTFHHKLITMDDLETSTYASSRLDASVYTFTATISNTAGLSKEVTIYQYPSMYLENKNGGNVGVHTKMAGATTNPYQNVWDDNYGNYTNLDHWLGGLYKTVLDAGKSNSNPNIYVINATTSSSNLVIGDPRETTGSDFGDDITGLSNYKKTASGTDNMVAPAFLIASSYGRVQRTKNNEANTAALTTGYPTESSNVTYNGAVKRCATYQEAGYPAGRWRVPTEAEIQYVNSLSEKGVIPSLFESTYYYASSGRLFNSNTFYDNTSERSHYPQSGTVRCVYDLWYWGEDKLSNTTSWGGYHTDYINTPTNN